MLLTGELSKEPNTHLPRHAVLCYADVARVLTYTKPYIKAVTPSSVRPQNTHNMTLSVLLLLLLLFPSLPPRGDPAGT